jgi:transposase InsO family protein
VPWKVSNPVDLKMEFLVRLQKGERMTALCEEFGISRKTGHKLRNRYEAFGAEGLLEESKAPRSIPHKTAREVVDVLLAKRRENPDWGARKIKDVLERALGRQFPAASTISEILARNGLVHRKPRRKDRPLAATKPSSSLEPNAIWCVDYKGHFRVGDGSYCYPLTISDHWSRYLLRVEGSASIRTEHAEEVFADAFREHGLPQAILSDNGAPFASTGLAGLTRLSAYWLRMGIKLQRIRPGHPEENGRHERMHLTLKQATTRPARSNLLQQQEAFDAFVAKFNNERPHQGLGMKRPVELYRPSTRPCPAAVPEPTYPLHDDTLTVCNRGFLRITRQTRVYLTLALTGQRVGIREEEPGRWRVSFSTIDLGFVESDGSFTDASHSQPTAFPTPPDPLSNTTTTTTTTEIDGQNPHPS